MATLEPPKVVNLTEGAILGKKDGEPYGYTDSELADKIAGTGTLVTADGLDADTAALVGDSESATKAALDAQYATVTQGGKADTALQPSDVGSTVQAHDADLDTLATGTLPSNLQSTLDARYLLLAGASSSGFVRTGSGMPNGSVSAPVGTLYIDSAATNGAQVWLKTSGSGNTGWTCVIGDTGWRRVLSWTSGTQDENNQIGTIDTSVFTPVGTGFIDLRRVNDRVTLRSSASGAGRLDAIAGGGDLMTGGTSFPSGFTLGPQFGTAVPAAYGLTGVAAASIRRGASQGWQIHCPTAASLPYLFSNWPTFDTWPTSLPGVAV